MKIIQSLKFAAGLGSYILAGKVTDNNIAKISAGFGGVTLVDKIDKLVEKKRSDRKEKDMSDDINREVSEMLTNLLEEDEDDDDDDSVDSNVEYELDIPKNPSVSKKEIFPPVDDEEIIQSIPEEIDDICGIRTNQPRLTDDPPIAFVDEHKLRRANRIRTNQAKKKLGGGKHNSRFDED